MELGQTTSTLSLRNVVVVASLLLVVVVTMLEFDLQPWMKQKSNTLHQFHVFLKPHTINNDTVELDPEPEAPKIAVNIPDDEDCQLQNTTTSPTVWKSVSPRISEISQTSPHIWQYTREDNQLLFSDTDLLCEGGPRAPATFHPRKDCKETCCVTTCLLPWNKTEHATLSVMMLMELSDVRWGQTIHGPGLDGRNVDVLSNQMLPCLREGTIIYTSAGKDARRFINEIHPHIKVDYTLTIGDADTEVPDEVLQTLLNNTTHLTPTTHPTHNTHLTHVFASNPSNEIAQLRQFTTVPLGLSRWHPQSMAMGEILKQRHYQNPFLRLNSKQQCLNFTRRVLKSYMTTNNRRDEGKAQREAAQVAACNNNTDDLVVCAPKVSLKQAYETLDDVWFGMSPEGNGHDCYRTWEYFYLGVVPIVQKASWTGDMYKDLPVLELDSFHITHRQLRNKVLEFTYDQLNSGNSGDGRNYTRGWRKLFFKHWREITLSETGRKLQEPTHPSHFPVFKYSLNNNNK